MKNKKYFSIIVIVLSLIIMLFIGYHYRHFIKGLIKGKIDNTSSHKKSNNERCPNCETIFIDNVKKQEEAYRTEGVIPQNNEQGLRKLLRTGKIKKVKSNSFYSIAKLNNSSPYLMNKAIVFLDKLSHEYEKKCNQKAISLVPFTISSLIRTKKDVVRLKKNNKNAIENSPHLRGKTFDVNYDLLSQNKTQLKCFIAALSSLRKKNLCFVKFEKNGCLHISVN